VQEERGSAGDGQQRKSGPSSEEDRCAAPVMGAVKVKKDRGRGAPGREWSCARKRTSGPKPYGQSDSSPGLSVLLT